MAIRILQPGSAIGDDFNEKNWLRIKKFLQLAYHSHRNEKIDALIIPGDIFDVATLRANRERCIMNCLVRLSRLK
jgi:DNA repair exonuclease SbcCD nuclease subunit